MAHVTIYTDGSCSPNPGPGGWAAVLINDGLAADDPRRIKEISSGACNTTNNRMELQAVIEALRMLKKPCEVDVYTDSQYVRQGVTAWLAKWQVNGWKTAGKQSVKNQDLWVILSNESKQHQIEWHWVEGHAGHLYNERCDVLASDARERSQGRG